MWQTFNESKYFYKSTFTEDNDRVATNGASCETTVCWLRPENYPKDL